jgi:hypothetical protein
MKMADLADGLSAATAERSAVADFPRMIGGN